MSATSARLAELLADEASAALEPADRLELDILLAREPALAGRKDFLRTASLVQVSQLGMDPQSARRMPERLRRQLAEQAEASVARQAAPGAVSDLAEARARRAGSQPGEAVSPTSQGRWLSGAAAGWYLAAALALAFVVYRVETPDLTGAMPGADRQQLLAEARDVVTLPWQAPTAPGFAGVSGDVVWSEERQSGYLRLVGMPVNDPARAQYQLWIVDPERDAHPVDGGVFNVSANGEVIIPIQARLHVARPKAFAITLEKPGGVVVSAGPLLVVAAG